MLAGHFVLFRTISDLLADLDGDSPGLRRRKFRFYARPALLCLDECGYLSYDAHVADLFFEIINHPYERNSILLTTNKAFKDWNTVFPNATCIVALLDRLYSSCRCHPDREYFLQRSRKRVGSCRPQEAKERRETACSPTSMLIAKL